MNISTILAVIVGSGSGLVNTLLTILITAGCSTQPAAQPPSLSHPQALALRHHATTDYYLNPDQNRLDYSQAIQALNWYASH